MNHCYNKATWKAVCKKKLIKRTSISDAYYCNSCKLYQQKVNDRWSKFEKIHQTTKQRTK